MSRRRRGPVELLRLAEPPAVDASDRPTRSCWWRSARSTRRRAAPTAHLVCGVSSAAAGSACRRHRVARLMAHRRPRRRCTAARSGARDGTRGWSQHRTCCSATSPLSDPICAGSRTSPSSPARTASSTSPASATSTTTASSAGRWANARPPTSSSPRWSWPWADENRPASSLHHADHGSQYTSIEFTNRLADWKLARLLRQRRRLLRQRRHGSVLGDAQEGGPPHLGTHRVLHPHRAPNDPVRLHRGLLQPLTPPGRPRRPDPCRDLRCPTKQPDLPKPRVHEIMATPRPGSSPCTPTGAAR